MADAPQHIRVSDVDGIAVVCFNDLNRCACNDERAHQLTQELLAVADHREWLSVILDFEDKDFIPAAIVESPLVKLHKRLGEDLRMCHVPAMAMEQFRMNRLATLFHIHETRKEALAAAMKGK